MTKASLQSESRRDILRFGAAGAVSALVGCSAEALNPGETSGGASGSGGTATAGAGGTAPTAGKGGTAGATGTAAGSGGTAGATATTGGQPTGGATVTGGTPNGGGSGGTPMTVPGGGGKENNGAACQIGAIPTVNNAKLPDPFKFISGARITKKDDWNCLRADLMAMAQAHIYGPKMPKPDTLTATYSGGTMTVNMKVGTQSASFMVKITGGGSATGKVPCLITCGGSSLPALSGVASITMANNTMSAEGKTVGSGGLVNMLYGNASAKSGSLIGWAWGLSRIIDGLELCPEAGIDLTAIAVTGCSRNGKGALAMGAFDERVALTIPQEGGSGGPALWRVSEKEKAMGQNIQESGEIVGEANWQGSDFKTFANGKNSGLAADQHTVIALCAPRAVLVIDNDIDWLGPVACYGGGAAAQLLYEGLGIKDRCGVSVAANHGHCSFPSAQQPYLTAFVNRFLKKMAADTKVDDFHGTNSKLKMFNKADWIDWDVPTLSGTLPWDPFTV